MATGVFAWLGCLAWLRPLMLPDEGRYGGVAWEMLRSGQWAVPTLDGMPYFHKPPLFYWIAAAAMRVLGPSQFVIRMPSLLGALLAVVALYLFARRWTGERHARWCVAVLATQPFFFFAAQYANLDMLVAGCVTAAIALGAHAVLLQASGHPYQQPLLGAFAAAAFGVLAKGLIGIVLPAGVLSIWLLLSRRPRALLTLVSVPGLALFMLIAMPWFAEMQRRYTGFYDYFVIYHHFRRYSQGGFNNEHGLWFYPVVMLVLALPSSLLMGHALRAKHESTAPLSVSLLMWCWLAFVVVFFSLPRSKLLGYVLPALPPFAWLLTGALLRLRRFPLQALALATGAILSVGAVLTVAWKQPHSAQTLGAALRAQRHPGEPVVFLNRYPFDLPFYARLEAAPIVTGEWQAQEIAQRDNWRKELYDAGVFDPQQASRRLMPPSGLGPLLCSHAAAWLVGTHAEVAATPFGPIALEAARGPDYSVWRVVPTAKVCTQAEPRPPAALAP
jgi:4-amino-4-deoxy-L-arabinose transferase-like glycosyltransferase